MINPYPFSHRASLFALSLLLLALAHALVGRPPNIVLIVSDDHGTHDLGAYGNNAISTPHLDSLAASSIRFTQAYATAASCTPSRSTIQSGLFNHANGLYGLSHGYHHFRAFDSVQTLPVLLAELGGYATARVGKYHVAPEPVYHYQTAIPADVLNPVEMAQNTRPFLEANRDKPFFLYYATIAPHRSGTYREDLPFRPNDFHNRPAGGYPGVEPRLFDPAKVEVPPYLPDTPACRQELAQYYEAVARLDDGVGTLLGLLRSLDLWENTLILYLSDNGIAFPGAKTNLYQGSLRLPFLAKLPRDERAGTACEAMVSWVDLTPTLLDYAGILPAAEARLAESYAAHREEWDHTEVPGFQGRSLRPLFTNPGKTEGWDTVFASHTFHEVTMYYPMRAIITRQYKLIWNLAHELPYPQAKDLWHSATWQYALEHGGQMGPRTVDAFTQRPEFELYDLQADPWEATNLADDPDHADTLAELKTRLRTFQQTTNDPWILKWDRE